MRLTLRTLLAYLDDILPPSQAREIGAKVTDTPDAAKLMQRIRDVVRRRRAGAPALSGSGSGPDPNIVAEYLDNSLSPQTVIELEKICLGSDMHLAEVASCHSILTLVLSEPVDVPVDMRERIHALGTLGKPAPVQPPKDTPLTGSEDVLSQAPAAASSVTGHRKTLSGVMDVGEMSQGLPDYLRQGSGWKKYGWTALVLGGLILWGTSIYFDKSYSLAVAPAPDSAPSATNSAAAGKPSAAHPTKRPEGRGLAGGPGKGVNPSLNQPGRAPTVPPTGTGTGVSGHVAAGVDSASPVPAEPVAPVVTAPASETAIASVPITEPAATNEPVATVPAAVEPAAPAAEVAPLPEVTALYTSGEGVVIVSSPMQPDWMVFPRRGIVHVGETIATPAPYEGSFSLSEGIDAELGLEIRLASETRVTRVEPKGLSKIGLHVHRGRVMLHRVATSPKPVKVMIQVGQQAWQIELSHPGTVCGVQVIPPFPIGPPGTPGQPGLTGGVMVVSGVAAVGLMGEIATEFRTGQGWVQLPAVGTDLVAGDVAGIPEWLTLEGTALTPSARQIARTFEKEFALDRPILETIPPVIGDRQAKVSELAVKTVALIGAYGELVAGLRSEHEEARLAAIEGLREWLPDAPDNSARLREELQKFYRDTALTTVEQLLWGYSALDARDPVKSRELVTWMNDDDVSIRELAFYHVFRLTGKKYDYRPNLLPTHRLAACIRWEEHLKRNSGTLVPQ